MEPIRRSAHPRLDWVRPVWQTLNGTWQFRFDWKNEGKRQRWYLEPRFDLEIQVPFACQAELSGIREKRHCDVVWYSRKIVLPESLKNQRVHLHFGAVDYLAEVWLNGQYLGCHEGGYTPFTFEITDLTEPGQAYTLTVRCEDRLAADQPRGKQSWHPDPFACWYTPVSGIWQSVWLEGTGMYYPVNLRLTPCLEHGSVLAEIELNELPENGSVRLTASFRGRPAARQEIAVLTDRCVRTELYLSRVDSADSLHLWSPENPDLYDLTVETLENGRVCDSVNTYFGMRKVEVAGSRILLNGEVLYQRLVLDQGYWPDGLLTAPDDEALKKDIELTKAMGFNGVRKHQKFEDPQYLYWADHLGLLVWGELPSAYQLQDSEKRNMIRDLSEAIRRDYNHPSLIAWTPLNESWGVPHIRHHKEDQKLADLLYALVHSLDGTRFVSGNDGWEQASTDVATLHDYTAWPEQLSPVYADCSALLQSAPAGRLLQADGYCLTGKPLLVTEYGGIAMARDAGGGNWGYNGPVQDEESFLERYAAITKAFRDMPFLCGYCYTQLTDVFQEVNGLLDMNRNPKADIRRIREINR